MASCSALRKPLFSRLTLGVALFGAAVLWPLLRQAHGRPWNTLWAEDGLTFVHDANTTPLHQTLFRSYSGYGHLVPRLLAMPTRYLPVPWIPSYVTVAGAVVAALVALFVYRACGEHVSDTWARIALAAACVLSPVLVFENEATIVNLFWLLTFATFWALVSRRERGGDVAARGGVALLGTASSPIAGLYLPVAATVLWSRRRKSDAIVAAAYGVGLVAQLATIATANDERPKESTEVADLVPTYAVRVLASAAIGERSAVDLWTEWGKPFAWLALVVAACAALGVWLRVDPARTRTAVVAVACSVALFAVPVVLRGSAMTRLVEGSYNHAGTRYFVAPVLLVVSAAAIVCGETTRSWWPKILLAQVLVVGVASLGVGARWRVDGPSWAKGVADAEQVCWTTPDADYGIPISPGGNWVSALPCARING